MDSDLPLMPKLKSILVIDDDPSMTGLLRMMLTKLGYACTTAKNGVEGTNMAVALWPDCILLDLAMPEMDGYAFLSRSQMQGSGDIPVVVLSSKSKTVEINRALDLGARGYVNKPVDVRKLAERLNIVMMARPLSDRSWGDGKAVFRG